MEAGGHGMAEMTKTMLNGAGHRSPRSPYVSRPQLRAAQRLAAKERLPTERYANATWTALERKGIAVRVAVPIGDRDVELWAVTPVGKDVVAAAAVPKRRVTEAERPPRVVSAR